MPTILPSRITGKRLTRRRSMSSTTVSKSSSSRTATGSRSYDVFHLAAGGADIVLRHAAGAEHEFKPSRPPPFGADFAAAEKIAFGHHTDQLPFRIDHRQAADAIAQHCARGLQNRRLCCNGNDIRRLSTSRTCMASCARAISLFR